MNRTDFLKIFGLGTTGLIMPNTTWSQKPVKIYDNHVRVMQHYQFKKIKSQLTLGAELSLKRELTNIYDSFAVEVYFNQYKLGYLAAYENMVIAHLLEQGVKFSAFISKLNPEDMYQGLAVEIYTHIIIENPKIIKTDLLDKRADDAVDIYRKGFTL